MKYFKEKDTGFFLFKLTRQMKADLASLAQASGRTQADLVREAIAELVWKYARRREQAIDVTACREALQELENTRKGRDHEGNHWG